MVLSFTTQSLSTITSFKLRQEYVIETQYRIDHSNPILTIPISKKSHNKWIICKNNEAQIIYGRISHIKSNNNTAIIEHWNSVITDINVVTPNTQILKLQRCNGCHYNNNSI